MKPAPNRRTVLKAAGAAAAVAAATWPAAAQSTEIRGAVTFEGGALIPEGQLEIYLEDLAAAETERRLAAETRIASDGKSEAITFALPELAAAVASPTLQIVARLERADGWLVARGSAPLEMGSPANVTLNTVMY